METVFTHGETLQFVTFRLAGQKYAVDILKVQEINNIKDITSIPNSPPYMEGAINLRGRVVPVLNLRKRFGIERKKMDDFTKIIVMSINDLTMGILVDAVSEVLRVPRDIVEAPPPVSYGTHSEFITGVAKLTEGLLLLLDMDLLLVSDEALASFRKGTDTGA